MNKRHIKTISKQFSNGIQIFNINRTIFPSRLGYKTQPSEN